jgi:hypothetical protein
MKEINEIREHLRSKLHNLDLYNKYNTEKRKELRKQLDNANKVAAKLQGAIDLFKDIEKL